MSELVSQHRSERRFCSVGTLGGRVDPPEGMQTEDLPRTGTMQQMIALRRWLLPGGCRRVAMSVGSLAKIQNPKLQSSFLQQAVNWLRSLAGS